MRPKTPERLTLEAFVTQHKNKLAISYQYELINLKQQVIKVRWLFEMLHIDYILKRKGPHNLLWINFPALSYQYLGPMREWSWLAFESHFKGLHDITVFMPGVCPEQELNIPLEPAQYKRLKNRRVQSAS